MALNLNDHSGNNNTLTNVGGTEVTTGLPYAAKSEAVVLSSDYLTAEDSVSLSLTGDFTIEGYFAGLRFIKTVDAVQDTGLARAVRPDDSQNLSIPDIHIDINQSPNAAKS